MDPDLKRLQAKFERARAETDRLQREREDAVLAAFGRRVPLLELAGVFKVSAGRISQMIKNARTRAKRDCLRTLDEIRPRRAQGRSRDGR